jgi:hypothetical protein
LRHRYGDEQHLEEALARVFFIGRPTGLPKRQCPRLKGLREEAVDGRYALVLEFQNRNKMSEEQWKERESKFASFFGPGISAEVRFCTCWQPLLDIATGGIFSVGMGGMVAAGLQGSGVSAGCRWRCRCRRKRSISWPLLQWAQCVYVHVKTEAGGMKPHGTKQV